MSAIAMRASRLMRPRSGLTYLVFAVTLVVVMFPLVWMLYTSFKPQYAIFEDPFALPTSLNFDNYVTAWRDGDFGPAFVNSIVVTLPSVLGVLAISSLAAYAFARLTFPGRNVLFVFVLAGLAIPPAAIVIPSYKIVSTLGLVDTYWSLIVTYLAWCPLGIVILTAFFRSLPKEIEEAAKVDGASTIRIFWKIALPLARPALATVAIFYFVFIWNDFLYPLLYLQSEDLYTIPLRLVSFKGQYSVDWGVQTAALSIATMVPVLFYLMFQSWFIRGVPAGAVKG